MCVRSSAAPGTRLRTMVFVCLSCSQTVSPLPHGRMPGSKALTLSTRAFVHSSISFSLVCSVSHSGRRCAVPCPFQPNWASFPWTPGIPDVAEAVTSTPRDLFGDYLGSVTSAVAQV